MRKKRFVTIDQWTLGARIDCPQTQEQRLAKTRFQRLPTERTREPVPAAGDDSETRDPLAGEEEYNCKGSALGAVSFLRFPIFPSHASVTFTCLFCVNILFFYILTGYVFSNILFLFLCSKYPPKIRQKGTKINYFLLDIQWPSQG
ncbi:Protein of unknown function [Gryllus bimaculatus]|nr:Protein of unknown function [Gryllus bimaculatus]